MREGSQFEIQTYINLQRKTSHERSNLRYDCKTIKEIIREYQLMSS